MSLTTIHGTSGAKFERGMIFMKTSFKEVVGTVAAIGLVLSPVILAGVAVYKQNKQTKENIAKLKAYKHKHGLVDEQLKECQEIDLNDCVYNNENVEQVEDKAILSDVLKNLYSKALKAKTVESFKDAYTEIERVRRLAFQDNSSAIMTVIFEEKKRLEDKKAADALKKERDDVQSQRKFELDKMSAIGAAVANLAKSAKPDPIQVVNNIGDVLKKTIAEEG